MSLQAKSPTSVKFKVYRGTPELVIPAKPTPYEFKQISDLENLDFFKGHAPILAVYSQIPTKNGIDPVKVIKKAIAETLVFYYPFAGRLREDLSGKHAVECTGEGVLFTEADADVTLEQFDYPIVPPLPCCDQLLFDVPGSSHIFNSPLVLFQVTRLKCGGFVFGIRVNHIMSDGSGIGQFMNAIGEIARGATSPSVLPIWERHIIHFTTNPQKLTSLLPASHMDTFDDDFEFKLEHDLCHRSFFLGKTEILALKSHLPPHLHNCTSFEIITASVWKCRIIAFQPDPTKWTSLSWAVNFRSKLKLPAGYYGNAFISQNLKSTAKEIIENPLSYILQLIQKDKDKVVTMEDCAQSIANLKINRISYSAGDWRYAGFEKANFGWGEAVYGGPHYSSLIEGGQLLYKNNCGENKIMLSMALPKQVMERFEKELNNMVKGQPFNRDGGGFQSKM